MAGEMRFCSRVATLAVAGQVNEVMALVSMYRNLDSSKAVHTTAYIFAYDFVNIRPQLLADTLRDIAAAVSKQWGYSVKRFSSAEPVGGVLSGVVLHDKDNREAVIGVSELISDKLRDTLLYKRFVIEGYVENVHAEGEDGERFATEIGRVVTGIEDVIFNKEMADVFMAVERRSLPSYIQ